MLTRDADLAFKARARLDGNIAATLEAAGFREEFSSDRSPPVARYHIEGVGNGFYAEFLAPLTGSGTKRDGSPDATVARAGVTAQKLRHLDVLFVAPWSLALEAGGEIPVRKPVKLLVANPVSFMVQKLLIHADRKPGKRAQDALYVHDTLQLFGARIENLAALWTETVRPSFTQKVAAGIPQLIREQYAAVNDVIRSAVRIPHDRTISPESFQAACAIGLGEVFGGV